MDLRDRDPVRARLRRGRSTSGGVRAAFGYRYQYLVTVEFVLRYVRDHLGDVASTVLHVEPEGFATRRLAADDEIVDFAVEVADTVVVSV